MTTSFVAKGEGLIFQPKLGGRKIGKASWAVWKNGKCQLVTDDEKKADSYASQIHGEVKVVIK